MSPDPPRRPSGASRTRGPESFGKERRILRRAEYLQIYETGRRIAGRSLVFFLRPGTGGAPRLGITITKKTGSSVVRNRLRRRIRELFRRTRPFPAPVDLVVNVRPGAEKAPDRDLAEDFARLARRAEEAGR